MRYSKDKDMVKIRETMGAKQQRHEPFATIKDYSLKNRVTIAWDINQDASRDQMFILSIGKNKAVIDWEEFQRAARFI